MSPSAEYERHIAAMETDAGTAMCLLSDRAAAILSSCKWQNEIIIRQIRTNYTYDIANC